MSLPACQDCGQPAMVFDAGTAPETVVLFGIAIVVQPGVPSHAWCERCWPWAQRRAA